jgi:hypothetical protein
MAPDDWRKARDIGVDDVRSFFSDLGQSFLHIDRIPMGNGVERETESAELFFLALTKRASDFAPFAMTNAATKFVTLSAARPIYRPGSCTHLRHAPHRPQLRRAPQSPPESKPGLRRSIDRAVRRP